MTLAVSMRREMLEERRDKYQVAAFNAEIDAAALEAQIPSPAEQYEHRTTIEHHWDLRANALRSAARLQELLDHLENEGDDETPG